MALMFFTTVCFFPHGPAPFGQTGRDHHGEHLRRQAHRHRQGKQKSGKPVSLGEPAGHKHHGDQHRHKANEHPGNGMGPLIKPIGHKGDAGQHQQNHSKGIDKSSSQPVKHGIALSPWPAVFAVLRPAFFASSWLSPAGETPSF